MEPEISCYLLASLEMKYCKLRKARYFWIFNCNEQKEYFLLHILYHFLSIFFFFSAQNLRGSGSRKQISRQTEGGRSRQFQATLVRMPFQDRWGQVCGFLNYEEKENSGRFGRRYFIISGQERAVLSFHDSPAVRVTMLQISLLRV